ncbi:MAG: hypothetical protein Q7Q71_13810 [Verrucomicrobiota bacterium JB023]|nr:hypothetical protein [Verrucomicrobiota bacterium JB023]
MPSPSSPFRSPRLILLRLAGLCLFSGYAWLYLDKQRAPLTQFLWNPRYREPIEFLSGKNWSQWLATSSPTIDGIIRLFGFLFLFAGLASLTLPKRPLGIGKAEDEPTASPNLRTLDFLLSRTRHLRQWVGIGILLLASLGLGLHAWAVYESKGHNTTRLFEQLIRLATPCILIMATTIGLAGNNSTAWLMRLAIASTFVGHGLFALGIFPPPQEWYFMVGKTLALEPEATRSFLVVAGVLDLLAAGALLLPHPLIARLAATYCTFWGFTTAIARPWAHFTPAEKLYGLDPWLAEGILRLPHGLLPLALCLALMRPSRDPSSTGR